MPPRIDPYANKMHRRIDIALIVITLLLMFFAFRVFAHERANEANRNNSNTPASQSNHNHAALRQSTRMGTNWMP